MVQSKTISAEHPGCCKTFPSQLMLLLRKNLAVLRRNKASTFVQFWIMLVVIVILFIFDADDKYNAQGINKYFFQATSHPDHEVGPIARCQDLNSSMPLCTVSLAVVFAQSFASSSNQVDRVLRRLYNANEGVEETVLRYNTSDELNEYMLDHPGSVLAALHFPETFDFEANPAYTVQVNQSSHCAFGAKVCSVPWEQIQLPLQVATETAILQAATGTAYEVNVKWSRFPNPELTELARDISQFIGPILVQLACIANFVIMLNQLIQEKEAKLKLLLRISGVSDSAMWVSWWVLFFLVSLWAGFLWPGLGTAMGFDALSQSDFGVIFTLFFLFYLALAAWACFLSTLIPTMTAGYALGFVLCIGMWLFGGVVNGIVFSGDVPPAARNAVGFLFPPLLFNRAFLTLNDVSIGGKDGMRWSEIGDDGYRCPLSNRRLFTPCDYDVDPTIPARRVLPIAEIYLWFIIQLFAYGLLAVYLDQVVDTGYGRPQKWYFVFQKSYWFPNAVKLASDTSTDVVDDEDGMDEDVRAEIARVQSGDGQESDAIRVVNLKKTFFKGRCSKVEFTAVFRVNVGIKNETLFCLLGHNGAGKTTTFNMLSGILEPTRGDAFVFGKSVKNQLRSVQSMMGICPQHDILWPELSAQDHLNLFAGLAHIPSSEIASKVTSFIKAVDLVEFGQRPSRTYSGGMKRRLSVACSLIADPSVVYLDEPTTGMDPVNRRGVWDVIEKAKAGRVVVLTTHAMEEADTLGDVISIMSRGRLHCLGTALRLKNRYGTGYHVDVEATEANRDAVLERVRTMVPSATAVGEHTISADVKLDEVAKMEPLCEMVERDLAGQGVQIAVSMCTLETVFISIAEAAGDPEQIRLRAESATGSSTGHATEMGALALGPASAVMPQTQLDGATMQPGATRSIVIEKADGQKVGLDLAENEAGTGCVVKMVYPNFAAAASKSIFAGDIITAVGGTAAKTLPKPQVLDLIRAAGNKIAMDVERSADVEAANTATSPVPSRPVVMNHGAVRDDDGVLAAAHLEFKLTPFSAQFSAVATKSKTNLKRQCCQTCFFTIALPGLFLTIYTLIKFLPSLIIGGNTLVPGVTTTSASAVDKVISNPNKNRIDEASNSIRQLIAIKQGCIDEDKDVVAASNLDRFEGWAYNHLCANQYASTLSAEQIDALTLLRAAYDCDTDFWDYIYPQYQYARDAQEATLLEKMPNITYDTIAGETYGELSCPQAYGVFIQTCDLPKICPSNYTDSDDLSPLMQVYAKAKEYNCSSDAVDMLEPYEPGQYEFAGETTFLAANISNVEVVTCMSSRFFCNDYGQEKCSGAPALLNSLPGASATFVECSTVDYPDSTAGTFVANNGGMEFATLAAMGCMSQAAGFCQQATLFDVCPGVVETLKPKITPVSFGAATSRDEKAAFGELIHTTDALEGCTNCYQDVLESTPTSAKRTMGNYTIQFDSSLADDAIAMPNIQCVDEESAAAECDQTRADLDETIFTLWSEIYAAYSTEGERRRRRGRGEVPAEEGKYQGAYHVDRFEIQEGGEPVIDFTVLYNGTIRSEYGPAGSVPNQDNEEHVPALVGRLMSLVYNQAIGTQLKGYVMGFPSAPHTFIQQFSLFLSWVFAAILGFMQIIITSQIVAEKATNMREIMTMSGLGRRPYWVITWLYSFCLYLVCLIFFFIVSYACDFQAITAHNFGVILVHFLLYCAAQTSYACFASTLFANKWAALVANFFLLVFVFVLMGWQLAEKATGYDTSSSGYQFIINILPTFAMSHTSEILSHAGIGTIDQRNVVPLTFSNIGAGTSHPIGVIMGSLVVAIIFWMSVAVYFDMVLPIGPGIKHPALFFFSAEFWQKKATKISQAELDSISMKAEPTEAPEVSSERQRVLAEQQDGVRVIGLSKIYPGATRYAVKNVQFGILKDECFGLLGSNGAGKTTTIHVLCGLHPPSTGTVICGEEALDIRVDLGRIQSSMGVCSQDNLLWDDLTGPEHLHFFGRLRRLKTKVIKAHTDFWLTRVNLNSVADRRKRSRSYSGGMKRRLNTANAFIGNPKLVYLDEPSTGLDPESRQQLWRAVLAAKPGKSIILTTHALEEAEALCDRVGIMTFGLMRTLGTPNQLRLRFDQGYKFMMAVDTADPGREATALTYVKELLPAARCVDSINGVHTYVVPKDGVKMSTIFSGMTSNKDKYHIKDWGLSHTTLEEVFLQIVSVNPLSSPDTM